MDDLPCNVEKKQKLKGLEKSILSLSSCKGKGKAHIIMSLTFSIGALEHTFICAQTYIIQNLCSLGTSFLESLVLYTIQNVRMPIPSARM